MVEIMNNEKLTLPVILQTKIQEDFLTEVLKKAELKFQKTHKQINKLEEEFHNFFT